MQADGPFGERFEPGDAAQCRCLAAAAQSEQREKFAHCTSNDIGPTLTCGEYRLVSSCTSSSMVGAI
jgi:hypothetical protein